MLLPWGGEIVIILEPLIAVTLEIYLGILEFLENSNSRI